MAQSLLKLFVHISPRRCHWAELTHGLQPFLSVVNQRAESPTYFSPTATPWVYKKNSKPINALGV